MSLKHRECYTFHGISGNVADQHDPARIPGSEWVLRACKQFVECGDAQWIDTKEGRLTFHFRKYDEVQEHFMTACLGKAGEDPQMRMFEDELQEN